MSAQKLGLPEPKPESQQKTDGGKAWTVLGEYIYSTRTANVF